MPKTIFCIQLKIKHIVSFSLKLIRIGFILPEDLYYKDRRNHTRLILTVATEGNLFEGNVPCNKYAH